VEEPEWNVDFAPLAVADLLAWTDAPGGTHAILAVLDVRNANCSGKPLQASAQFNVSHPRLLAMTRTVVVIARLFDRLWGQFDWATATLPAVPTVDTVGFEDNEHCDEDDLDIDPEAPVVDVPEVKRNALVPSVAGAAVNLLPSGRARLDKQPSPVPF
jgi:hypothetical protein